MTIFFVFFAQVRKNVDFSQNDFVNTYNVKMYPRNFVSKFFDISKFDFLIPHPGAKVDFSKSTI